MLLSRRDSRLNAAVWSTSLIFNGKYTHIYMYMQSAAGARPIMLCWCDWFSALLLSWPRERERDNYTRIAKASKSSGTRRLNQLGRAKEFM